MIIIRHTHQTDYWTKRLVGVQHDYLMEFDSPDDEGCFPCIVPLSLVRDEYCQFRPAISVATTLGSYHHISIRDLLGVPEWLECME